MIPIGTRVTFLEGTEVFGGDVLSNGNPLSVIVTDNKGWMSRHTVPLSNVNEIFAEKVYTVIVTNPNDGKTKSKSFYVAEQAEAYHLKCFEHPNWIVHFDERIISSWLFFQKSRW